MIDLSSIKSLSFGGISLKQLSINGVLAWQEEPEEPMETLKGNLVPSAIDENGNILNGVGYVDDSRVSSSGAIKTQSGTPLTGYIRCDGISDASVIRTKGVQFVASLYCGVVFYDSNFNLIQGVRFPGSTTLASGTAAIVYASVAGTTSTERDDGVTEITFNFNESVFANYPPTYFRLFAQGDGANMIVTVNEEIAD